jgi:hypothetical protein
MALLRWIGEKVVVFLAMAVLLIATVALVPIGIILAKIEQRERLPSQQESEEPRVKSATPNARIG